MTSDELSELREDLIREEQRLQTFVVDVDRLARCGMDVSELRDEIAVRRAELDGLWTRVECVVEEQDDLIDDLVGEPATAEEIEQRLEHVEARIAQLEARDPAFTAQPVFQSFARDVRQQLQAVRVLSVVGDAQRTSPRPRGAGRPRVRRRVAAGERSSGDPDLSDDVPLARLVRALRARLRRSR